MVRLVYRVNKYKEEKVKYCRVGYSLIGFSSKSLIFGELKSDLLVKNSESLSSLFFHEPRERITHDCSFVTSDRSDSLTVALL